MATSPRPSIDNELASQGALAATVCQVSYHQWPDLFTIISTKRKFSECLNCAVSPPSILHVLSCSIESPVICSLYGHSSHIHTFMHPHVNTFIYSHIQAYTTRTYAQYQFTHDCISRLESCLVISHQFNHQLFQVASPTQRTAWGLFSVFHVVSPTQRTTWGLFSVFQVVSPTQRTAWGLFSVFQVVSPTQRTAWGLFLSFFQVVSPTQRTT